MNLVFWEVQVDQESVEPTETQDLLDKMVTTTCHENKEVYDWLYFLLTAFVCLTSQPHSHPHPEIFQVSQAIKVLKVQMGVQDAKDTEDLMDHQAKSFEILVFCILYKDTLNFTK